MIRRRVWAFAAEHGASAQLLAAIQLAVTEAVANAVKHGYGGAGGELRVDVDVEDGELEVVVADGGRGFASEADEGLGLGLALMRGRARRRSRSATGRWAGSRSGCASGSVRAPRALLRPDEPRSRRRNRDDALGRRLGRQRRRARRAAPTSRRGGARARRVLAQLGRARSRRSAAARRPAGRAMRCGERERRSTTPSVVDPAPALGEVPEQRQHAPVHAVELGDGLRDGAPIFIRIFKREFELEMWMKRDGKFERFATYPICMWSGKLGPKMKQGDRQAPEGFYTVDSSQLNPNSQYHRSFNLGFPNTFDRAHGRTGSLLMVHGDCRSIGCYAMTDGVIDEVWSLLTAALGAGQKRVQVQVFPFRMTEANMSRHAANSDIGFWRQLKTGHDAFERDHVPPVVSVCGGRYTFRPATGVSDGSAPIDVSCPAT